MPDQILPLNADSREALRTLQAAPKFNADRAHHYAGAPSERIRAQCEGHINDLIAQILELPAGVRPAVIHQLVQRALTHLDAYPSQERDRFCQYLEQLLDITGSDDSTGLLHQWRYGPT